MDMTRLNEAIKKADDNPQASDGPRFPNGDYVMTVVDHEMRNKYEIPNTDPLDYRQIGFWVTFRILEGEYKGKDFKKYYGIRHPDSKACVRFGLSGLKKLYKAVDFVPEVFGAIYGKRFVATLESNEQDDPEYPWDTEITAYSPAAQPAGQSFAETVQNVTQTFDGQAVAPGTKMTVDEIPF